MVEELCSGPCMALEIRTTDGSEAPKSFREFVGPADPVSILKRHYSKIPNRNSETLLLPLPHSVLYDAEILEYEQLLRSLIHLCW